MYFPVSDLLHSTEHVIQYFIQDFVKTSVGTIRILEEISFDMFAKSNNVFLKEFKLEADLDDGLDEWTWDDLEEDSLRDEWMLDDGHDQLMWDDWPEEFSVDDKDVKLDDITKQMVWDDCQLGESIWDDAKDNWITDDWSERCITDEEEQWIWDDSHDMKTDEDGWQELEENHWFTSLGDTTLLEEEFTHDVSAYVNMELPNIASSPQSRGSNDLDQSAYSLSPRDTDDWVIISDQDSTSSTDSSDWMILSSSAADIYLDKDDWTILSMRQCIFRHLLSCG